MAGGTKYKAKKPDENGFIEYSNIENETWGILYERQHNIIQGRACKEYIDGHQQLALPTDSIPQLPDVSDRLRAATNWEVAGVPALISFGKFFNLLANRKFPAATFIRTREELEYLQEPDIFHEVYGHCPMLTEPVYADFMQEYGKIGVDADEKDQVMLARLYWFTVEFGLIERNKDLKAYGAGILSSIGETVYALESEKAERRPFDLIDVLRTPYRIDIFQPIYYVIESYQQLFELTNLDLLGAIKQARELGMFKPTYPPKPENDN